MKYFFSIEEERAAEFMLAANDVGITWMSCKTSYDGITTFTLYVSPDKAIRRMHEAYTNPKAKPTSNE